MALKFVLFLIFAIFVAIFAIQNSYPVDVQFFSYDFFDVSQAVVIIISAIAGGLFALLFSVIKWISYKSKMRGSNKSIASLEGEVAELRQKVEQANISEEALKQEVALAKAETGKAIEEAQKTKEQLNSIKDSQITQAPGLSENTESSTAESAEGSLQEATPNANSTEQDKDNEKKRKWYQF